MKNLFCGFFDGDLISMFGNLFDNAMEAVIKCPSGKRNLDLKLYMGSDYFLVLQMTNSYAESIWRMDKRLLSTKRSIQHHGLGIGIVSTLAEKYGGVLELKELDGEFLTLLMISNYGNIC